ncbi:MULTISPECIES: contact-dependent growth inhibition system immunity protein [unclassified Paraburkholderia]|uniref:contact-dependent growth inhibition system immunity protein n=1 Tax=unclassified Paraburkholderia TaxID=2615204 RepID=UPI001F043574|nr:MULTISPECIES: contact-dependent growth inhibition system immunity protein [unclassified Paraburkholderia]
MMPSEHYSQMSLVFRAYFGQDFDLFGNTIPEIVSCYKKDNPQERHNELINEINYFMDEHPNDLDSTFETKYGTEFDPALWGHTTASFLDELKRLLNE